jgi:hypothetical protein
MFHKPVSVLRHVDCSHQSSQTDSHGRLKESGSRRAKESGERVGGGRVSLWAARGVAKSHNTTRADVAMALRKTCILNFKSIVVVLATIIIVVRGVFELLDALAQTPHQLRNLPAAEQQQHHQGNQNDLRWTDTSHD